MKGADIAVKSRPVRYFGELKFISEKPGRWVSQDGLYCTQHAMAGTTHEQWEVHLMSDGELVDLIDYGLTMQEAVQNFLGSLGRHQPDDEVSWLAGTTYNVSLAYRLIKAGIIEAELCLAPVAKLVDHYGFEAFEKVDDTWAEPLDHISIVAMDGARAEAMPVACLEWPCLAAVLPIGIGGRPIVFLLNGRHRLFKAHLEGRESLKTYLLREADFIERIIWR